MTKKATPSSAESGEIRSDGLYEITVSVPFEHKRVLFLPGQTAKYVVKGTILSVVRDKVSAFRKVG